MIDQELLIIILTITIICVFIYILFSKPSNSTDEHILPVIKPKKRVRFNENITLNLFDKNAPPHPTLKSDSEPFATTLDQMIGDELENTWEKNFGKPLVSEETHNKNFEKMTKEFRDYKKSMNKFQNFLDYEGDVVKVGGEINPFRPDKRSLRGKTVGEIYDEQIIEYIPKPRDSQIEKSLDCISGKGDHGKFKPASFGNEF